MAASAFSPMNVKLGVMYSTGSDVAPDLKYLVPMSVGVPAQRLAAVLDTGTATFYTSNVNASTANATSQDKPAVLGYSSGQVRVPSFYTAATRISFNDSFLAVIKYEGAALLKYAPVGPHRASGVLGLAWSGWNKYGRSLGNGVRTGALCGSKFNQPCNNTGLLEAMMAVGAIPAGKAKFSIWLNKRWNRGKGECKVSNGERWCTGGDYGKLIIGGSDSSLYTGSLTKVRVTPNTQRTDFASGRNIFWQMAVERVYLVLASNLTTNLCTANCTASVDSGSPTIGIVSQQAYNKMMSALNNGTRGCAYKVVFALAGGKRLELPLTATKNQRDPSCTSTMPRAYITRPPKEARRYLPDGWFTLGLPFLQHFYTVFSLEDYGGAGSMAFAPSVQDALLSPPPSRPPPPLPVPAPGPSLPPLPSLSPVPGPGSSPSPDRLSSYVVAVTAATAKGVPNQNLRLTVGSANYQPSHMSISSADSLVAFNCYQSSCQGNPAKLYSLSRSTTLSKEQCTADTMKEANSCWVDGRCKWSYTYANVTQHAGNAGEDRIAVMNYNSPAPVLAVPDTTFGCSYRRQSNPADTTATCPAPVLAGSTQTCSSAGVSAGHDRSPTSLPSQLSRAGLTEDAWGYCYTPLTGNVLCSGSNLAAYVVYGAARPKGVSLQSVKMMTKSEVRDAAGLNGWGEVHTERMLAKDLVQVAKVSMLFGVSPAVYSYNVFTGTCLLDTGAGGTLQLPQDAFSDFSVAVSSKALSTPEVKNCPMNLALASCGKGVTMCYTMSSANSSVATATSKLMGLFPPSINITFEGGATAAVAPAQPIVDCASQTVLACSYVSATNLDHTRIPTAFWLSNSFFWGRFSQFDRRVSDGASRGRFRFSGTDANCPVVTFS